eukprot:2465707-Rhodomonas_salina.2
MAEGLADVDQTGLSPRCQSTSRQHSPSPMCMSLRQAFLVFALRVGGLRKGRTADGSVRDRDRDQQHCPCFKPAQEECGGKGVSVSVS